MEKALYALAAAIVIAAGLITWGLGKEAQKMPSDTSLVNSAMAAETAPALDTQARQAAIIGQPPRILPLDPSEIGADALVGANELRKAVGLPPVDKVTGYTATMLRYKSLYEKHTALALEFFGGAIGVHDRELAVLRLAWICQAPYEWGEHVKISKREVGLTTVDIERVIQGSKAPGWNEHDRAILRAVEELHDNAMISDETWAVLAKTLNEKQLIELPLLVGQYQGVAYLQNTLRMRMIQGNEGLVAR